MPARTDARELAGRATDFVVLRRCGGGSSGAGVVSSMGLFAGTVLGGSEGVAMDVVARTAL